MRNLDAIIHSDCTDANAKAYTEADTRNHLAFLELEQYNNTATFAYIHPLLTAYKLEQELNQLRRVNPEQFMNDLINASKNITRYRSMINSKKYKSNEELKDWLAIIEDYQNKLTIMKTLISK